MGGDHEEDFWFFVTKRAADIEREYWDAHAGEYEPITEEAFEEFFSFAGILPDAGRALEAGCGSGSLGRRLARRFPGLAITGMDIAPRFLGHYPFRGSAGDGTTLPFRAGSFSLLVFPASLHHMHPWEAACEEAARVLAPGGVLLMYETNIHHPWRRIALSDAFRRFFLSTTDEPLDCDRIAEFLATRGFADLRVAYSSLTPASPGVLGKVHLLLDRVPRPAFLERYLRPWFFLSAKKS